jgi:hypothetical protein
MPKSTDKTAQDIYEDAMKLTKDERDRLSLMLAQESDGFFATPEIEQAWNAEIERREQLFLAGKMSLVDADEVFRKARKILGE